MVGVVLEGVYVVNVAVRKGTVRVSDYSLFNRQDRNALVKALSDKMSNLIRNMK